MPKVKFSLENAHPILRVRNMAASREFYVDTLGFHEADWGNDEFTYIDKNGHGLYLCCGGQGNFGTWIWMGVRSGDLDQFYQDLVKWKVQVVQPPMNFSWAKEMHVRDPDGHILRFGMEPDENMPFHDDQIKSHYK